MFGTQQTPAVKDYQVPSSPADGVSSLAFNPQSTALVSGSWDNAVRCWELQRSSPTGPVTNAVPKAQINHDGPVLSVDWSQDGTTVFSGGCDKVVKMWALTQAGAQPQNIGQHDAPIKSVKFITGMNVIVSASWDKQLKFWDARQPTPVATQPLSERVYSMDCVAPLLVAATADRQISVFDLTGGQPRLFQRVESPLKYQTRCVACFPDRTGYAVGSIEGRVGIEYLDEIGKTIPGNKKSFAFKCHRDTGAGGATAATNKGAHVYAVNTIAFHRYGTFATAGADGCFNYWDKDSRQRLKAFPKLATTIPTAVFNPAGDLFAYAVSYDWSQGSEHANTSQPNNIFLHHSTDEEIKPRDKNKK